jgi:hypothetical protein
MADQQISGRAIKRLAAELGESRFLLFDAQEKLNEANQKIADLEADNKKLTGERDDLQATVERLMGASRARNGGGDAPAPGGPPPAPAGPPPAPAALAADLNRLRHRAGMSAPSGKNGTAARA